MKPITGLMSEHIYGAQYTFTVYPKTISELVNWVKERLPDGELRLDLCNSIPGEAGLHLFASATIHTVNGEIVEDSVNFTGKFWDVGELTLYLFWYVNQYVTLGTVRVRYPVLRVYISDELGSKLSGVEVKATLSTSYWVTYRGVTDVNGIAVMDIVDGSEPLNVYARKAGYNDYPDWTYLGQTPAPWVKGGDVEISGVLRYTGAQPPPPVYINVTVRVFHAVTKQPVQGATVTLDMESKATNADGVALFTDVQGGRDVNIKVSCPGYKDYSGTVSLPQNDMEIGIGLLPTVTVELKLSVDRVSITEGEEVTFTGTLRVNGQPSTETVELVEILGGGEFKLIEKFNGDFTYRYKPSRGIHSYATCTVIYNTKYWSNMVTVEVLPPGQPPTPPPPPPPPGFSHVRIHVHDALTGEPIAGATVRLNGVEARTGDDGVAMLTNIATGRYTLRVEKPLYISRSMGIEVPGNIVLEVDVGMVGGVKQGIIAGVAATLTALLARKAV